MKNALRRNSYPLAFERRIGMIRRLGSPFADLRQAAIDMLRSRKLLQEHIAFQEHMVPRGPPPNHD